MQQISIFNYIDSPVVHKDNVLSFPVKKEITYTPVRNQTACVIKDADVLASIKSRLLTTGKYALRNYTIFVLALNTGLRMGDVLTFRLADVYDFSSMRPMRKAIVVEEKTGKKNRITLTDAAIEALTEYIPTIPDATPTTPLFPSRKKVVHTKQRRKNDEGCLNVKSYWEILHKIAQDLGVEHLSCHSTRKTYAWSLYQLYKGRLIHDEYSPLDYVQKKLNHSSTSITLRYIGIDDEADEEIARNLNL